MVPSVNMCCVLSLSLSFPVTLIVPITLNYGNGALTFIGAIETSLSPTGSVSLLKRQPHNY